MFKIYHCFAEELPPKFCSGLLEILEKREEKEGLESTILDSLETGEKRREKVRNNKILWLNDPTITALCNLYVKKANKEAGWNFQLDPLGGEEIPQVSFYREGEFYSWHTDTGVEKEGSPTIRKLSLGITLNSDFKGGDFQIQEWVHPEAKKKLVTVTEMRKEWSIIVFPSFLYHRVKPVKKGKRCSLVYWARGRPFS